MNLRDSKAVYINSCRSVIHPLVEGANGTFALRIEHHRLAPTDFRAGRRVSVRAVVWDRDSDAGLPGEARLLLVRSARLGDYKFPGGGIETGEDEATALARELREEAGHVTQGEPVLLGTVEECWHEPGCEPSSFVLESRYYTVSVGAEPCARNLEDYEAELGFEPVWQTPAEAIAAHDALVANPRKGLRSWIRRETAVLRWLAERARPQPTGDDLGATYASRPAIGIDIDGCLVDTIRHSAGFLSARMGKPVSEWDIIHGWTGIPDIDRYFEQHGEELLGALPPYAHAAELIAYICASTEVFLVSARGEYNRGVTERWLDRHGIKAREVVLTGGAGKLSVFEHRGIKVFVEDSPINARDLAGAGVLVLLLDTAYNRYLEHPGVIRCSDWPEIRRRLKSWLASSRPVA